MDAAAHGETCDPMNVFKILLIRTSKEQRTLDMIENMATVNAMSLDNR